MKYILRCPDCFSTNLQSTFKGDHDFICLDCDEKHVFREMDFEEGDDDTEGEGNDLQEV